MQLNIIWKMLTMKECGDSTRLTLISAWPLARIAGLVASHAGELVVAQVRPWWAGRVTRDATQQCVWIQHKSPLTLGAKVCLGASAAHTCLVALCRVIYRTNRSESMT